MHVPLRIRHLRVYPLNIPMRLRFEHAAAARDTADPVVIELAGSAPYAHRAGYGETLARPYVTGETAESVVNDIAAIFAPRLMDFRPTSFTEALEFIEALPYEDGSRVVTAARAAVELALLDLAGKAFQRRAADAAGWLGLPGFGPPGCLATARYSGIVVGRTKRKLQWFLRLQRCYGLTDFKLKVAVEGWEDRLEWAAAVLRRDLAAERATLRVDANGGWDLEEAALALPALTKAGVGWLEQPLPDEADEQLAELARYDLCQIIADESLLTLDDARRLIAGGSVRVLNIRIAKNGGLLPALQMARMAIAAGLDVQLGCLVGETSILTAAGVAFLEACPSVRFVEGAFGSWLLRQDVVERPIRFGRGGRVAARAGFGLGVEVDAERLAKLCPAGARMLAL